PPTSTLSPYTTLFRSRSCDSAPGARKSSDLAQHAATIYLPCMLKRVFNRQVVSPGCQEYGSGHSWKAPESQSCLCPIHQFSIAPSFQIWTKARLLSCGIRTEAARFSCLSLPEGKPPSGPALLLSGRKVPGLRSAEKPKAAYRPQEY